MTNVLNTFGATQTASADTTRVLELSLDTLEAVSGGECTMKPGVCVDKGNGHIECRPTIVVCK